MVLRSGIQSLEEELTVQREEWTVEEELTAVKEAMPEHLEVLAKLTVQKLSELEGIFHKLCFHPLFCCWTSDDMTHSHFWCVLLGIVAD